ncbi:MAG: hypothetical protein GY711_28450 [bacterium]|nr:hypothetical protein [bacterium]
MSWTAENLLADTAWMRELASRLVADAALADDLVQDAWVLALRRHERPSRAWLGGVLRKLSFTRRRADARRAEREHRHAERSTAEPDAAHALACPHGRLMEVLR